MDRHTTNIDASPLPPPAPRGTPAIRLDVVRSVRLHPLLAASVAAATFAAIAGYAVTRKPVYKAEALIYVEPITAKILSDGSDGLFDATRYESYLQQQIQTVQRPDILQAAVQTLPVGYWHFPGESTANAAARLGNSLKIERQGTSFQVSLSLMGPEPVSTADAVNAVTTAYLQKGRKDETTRTDGRVQLLSEEKDRLGTELQADRAEQVALGSTLGVANPVGPTADAYDTDLSSIRAELVAARQAHDVAAAQLASVTGPDSASTSGMAAIATQDTASDPGLQALKTSFSQRRAVLTTQMAGLTPANPLYKQDQAELAQLDQQLAFRASLAQNVSAQQLRDRLRLELKRTGDVEARLNGQLAHSTALATGAAPRLQRASELAADIDRLQTRYASVDNALRGLQLEANGPGVVHLSVPATPPTAPEPSRRKLLLMAALPLALLFGGLAAVLARRRSGRVYTESDLEPILGFVPIGAMPSMHGLSSGEAGEYLLRMAAGLERAHRRGAVQTFVFTAASSSTDISAFVAAMAQELERLGFRTRLQRTGELLRSWDAPSSESEIIVAGIRQGIGARLEALKQRTDFVLLDAPPLLHSAETEYFLSAADTTVLLIESGVTTETELNRAMDLLRKLRVGGLAAVLLTDASEAPSADRAAAPARAPEPQPERTPEPPPAPRPGRWAGAFSRREETSSSLSFVPSSYDDAQETQYAKAETTSEAVVPLMAEAPTATTGPAEKSGDLPAVAAPVEIVEQPQRLEPHVAAKQYDTGEAVSLVKASSPGDSVAASTDALLLPAQNSPQDFAAMPLAVATHTPAETPQFLPVTEEMTPTAVAAAPESATSAFAAPSMLLWEAHIRHRAPDVETVAEPVAATAAPAPTRTAFTQYAGQSQSQSSTPAAAMTWTPFDGFRPFTPVATAEKAAAETAAPEPLVRLAEANSVPAPIASVPEPAAILTPVAATTAVSAEPEGVFAPPAAVREDLAAAQAEPTLIETLIAAAPAPIVEPRRLPSSAERLAFRPNVPQPRRPSLPSVPVAMPQVVAKPAAPAPRLVPPARPAQAATRGMSAGEVAERIVSQSSTRVPIAGSTRPHIMPVREQATAGRRWAMLSRFGKPAETPALVDDGRDRAAG